MLRLQGCEMRPGKIKIDRVKRQLLGQAVAENLDTMRGLPPRALRPARRTARAWVRRAPLLLVPIALLGSSYLGSRGPAFSESRGDVRAAMIAPPARPLVAQPRVPETPQP